MELVFWQSIANSTNPAEFEAYLAQFPNGVFRTLAEARLSAVRGSVPGSAATTGSPATGDGNVGEGPFVDGERHGDSVVRAPDGRVEVRRFENGERVDRLAAALGRFFYRRRFPTLGGGAFPGAAPRPAIP